MRDDIFIIGTKIIPAYVSYTRAQSLANESHNPDEKEFKKQANKKWNAFKKL
jgi:hypothetical protein